MAISNLIPYDSVDTLIACLNSELSEGRAIKFHENGGIFARNVSYGHSINKYMLADYALPSRTPIDIRRKYASGLVFERPIRYEMPFFRKARLSDLFADILKSLGLEDGDMIAYGPTKDCDDIRRNFIAEGQLDSFEYGPVSGILLPSAQDARCILTFEGKSRFYWSKGQKVYGIY
jgi:hypothetical protein